MATLLVGSVYVGRQPSGHNHYHGAPNDANICLPPFSPARAPLSCRLSARYSALSQVSPSNYKHSFLDQRALLPKDTIKCQKNSAPAGRLCQAANRFVPNLSFTVPLLHTSNIHKLNRSLLLGSQTESLWPSILTGSFRCSCVSLHSATTSKFSLVQCGH